uniref:Uncharacterized protein n=1 Tax=Leersia perrieri TaxID=77586 RepID=A0A0D9WG23_9ORYZ
MVTWRCFPSSHSLSLSLPHHLLLPVSSPPPPLFSWGWVAPPRLFHQTLTVRCLGPRFPSICGEPELAKWGRSPSRGGVGGGLGRWSHLGCSTAQRGATNPVTSTTPNLTTAIAAVSVQSLHRVFDEYICSFRSE